MVIAGAVLVGLLVGSFLNVVISRVPVGASVVSPPSHCPHCERTLTWPENIPLVSWSLQRGRCRSCGAPISARYPLVEGLTALIFAGVAARVGWDPALPAFLVAAAGMVALAFIDLDTQRLPNRVLFPTTVATAALLALAAAIDGAWGDLARAATGGAIAFAILLLIHVAKPAGMGFGDVKLAFLCGLTLGWWGLADMVIGLYGGFVLGAIVGVVLIATKRAGFGKAIPFGPYMIAGTLLMVMFGAPLADAVRDWF